MSLSKEEKIRYARHLSLNGFGAEKQRLIKKAKVLVIGTGGLGAPLLQYLTAVGVGTIGVMDFDIVDESNLQRQVLFGTHDVGQPKTAAAIKKLKGLNPHVHFIEHEEKLTSANALAIFKTYDLIADGTDNFPTRYLVNDACYLLNKPYVYASIYQFEGQLSVFNFEDGPNYRDLFPEPPPPGLVPSCAEGGVLGVLPGILGSMQASEVIKTITGIGKTLSGKLFVFDTLTFDSRTLNIRKDPKNPLSGEKPTITELIDYELFCGIEDQTEVKSIQATDLQLLISSDKNFTLIDVREPDEFELGHLNAQSIPLGSIEHHLEEIPKHGKVVFYCRSGKRSAQAIQLLHGKHMYRNLVNLEGGLLAWKKQIDPDFSIA